MKKELIYTFIAFACFFITMFLAKNDATWALVGRGISSGFVGWYFGRIISNQLITYKTEQINKNMEKYHKKQIEEL